MSDHLECTETGVTCAMLHGALDSARFDPNLPASAWLDAALKRLSPEHPTELVASQVRYNFERTIADREPEENFLARMRRWCGATPTMPEHAREIEWLEANLNPTSYTMHAFLADLHKKTGNDERAQHFYQKALRIVAVSGDSVME